MKKVLLVVFVATLVVSGIFASGQKEAGPKKIRAMYSTMTLGAPYFVEVANGMKSRGAALGWEVNINDPKGDIPQQVAALETAIAQKYDVIFLSALDKNAVKDVVMKAVAQGIKVITEATMMDAGPQANVGPGEEDMGNTLGIAMGKWASANMSGDVKIATYHVTQDPNTLRREGAMRTGFESEYKKGKITYVASLGGLTPEDGLKNMEGLLQSNPDINFVMGCNDDSIMGSYQAAKSAGVDMSRRGFGGVNAIPQALELMREEAKSKKGAYRVTVDIVPFKTGEMCIDLAKDMLDGKPFEKNLVIPTKAVTWDNVESYFKK